MLVMSSPSIVTLPADGLSSVPIMLRRVVFPDPEGPVMTTNSARWSVKLTPRSACTVTLPRRYVFSKFNLDDSGGLQLVSVYERLRAGPEYLPFEDRSRSA